MMVWLLIGCMAETAGEGSAGMDNAAFLETEVLAGIPERAWIEGLDEAAIGWGEGAIAVGRGEGEERRIDLASRRDPGLPVFAIEEGALGVVAEEGQAVRLLVTVPRAMLRPVLVEETLAVPDPARFNPADPLAPGLLLPAGTRLDPGEAEGGFVRAEFTGEHLRAGGWAPAEAIDRFARSAPEGGHSGSGDLWLAGGTMLLDAPGGEPFAWLEQDQAVRRLRPAEAGFVLVESAQDRAKARGYVPAPAEEPLAFWGWGSGGWDSISCGLYARFDPENLVPAGTRLHLSPGGPVVGEVLRDLDAPVMDREEGWDAVEIETRWGPVDLWIAP